MNVLTSEDVRVLIAIASTLDPSDYDNPLVRSVLYKAQSMVAQNGEEVVVEPFQIRGDHTGWASDHLM